MSRDGLFIAIEGVISSGKSVFAKNLAALLTENGYPAIHQEELADPDAGWFLERFYKDMPRWAFHLQVYFLHARYRMHQQAAVADHPVIQDRSIYGDIVFARLANKLGNMSDVEFRTYDRARENMMLHMVYPDLVIYLDIGPEQALRRVQKRGQIGDDGVFLEYLHGLKAGYDDMIENLSAHCPIVRVAWMDYPDADIPIRVKDVWATASKRITRGDWCRRQGW